MNTRTTRRKPNGLRAALAACLGAALAGPVCATPWHNFGPRAMGMGGAHVAVAQGPVASYWNPGGLGQRHNTSGLLLPLGVRGEFTGTVLQGANDLNQLYKECVPVQTSNCTNARIQAAVSRMGQRGNGVLGELGGGGELKLGRLVLFVNNLSYVGGNPQVDTVNATTATISNNQSKLRLSGGSFTELGLGYGRELGTSGLSVGANLKGIVGKIGYHEISSAREDTGGGSLTDFSKSSKVSFRPALDLGAHWDLRETWNGLPMRPRLGLVARNINGPRFEQPDTAKLAGQPSDFKLDGQIRAGVSLSPFKFWHLAADMDLTENKTLVDGFKSRNFSAGTELNIFNRTWINIPLRAGLQKNLASADSGVSYSLGFGLNFLHLIVDVGGMVSAKQVDLQTEGNKETVPNNFSGGVNVAFLFGGRDTGVRKEGEGKK